ncbi:MAG: chromate efflux transporter [Tepidisphaeraceae bacterium]
MADPPTTPPERTGAPKGSLREIACCFLVLGFTAFGGPAAHLAMMEQELVHKRRWLDRQHFLDLIAAINFIPGPNSTELVIALGRLRGGWRGLFVAGACFILPAVLIILPIAWLYVTYHQTTGAAGLLQGISAAVVAIIIIAGLRLAKTALRDGFAGAIATLAAAGEWLSHQRHWALGDVCILALAALAGWARASGMRPKAASTRAFLLAPVATIAAAIGSLSGPLLMTLLFLKIGATLFGSGYVLVTYLQTSFVDHRHWLTGQQLLDSVAVGQVTPGPLLTTATFVGFVLGHDRFGGGLAMEAGCALAATAAIFAPAFVLIAGMGSWLDRIRHSPRARAVLDAMNAAVVGLIASTCFFLGQQAMHPPELWLRVGLILACLGVMLRWNLNATWLIAASGGIGWLFLR